MVAVARLLVVNGARERALCDPKGAVIFDHPHNAESSARSWRVVIL
jgi:hypothetical protein